ncbi:hypothetical protein J2I47_21390 [Fibrella sp. HMF5335]|uniref:Exo-alpha-sialidase n=1 Tax=Fibrella rubiginis TaxID=2817060 RepID=A0A939GMH3_9BACT|nr:hypothetical protein [Fibrella rubiginis]MBO0939123.1 hypothetical protein [Fibrella rubiginis]
MKHVIYCLMILFVMACRPTSIDIVAPEYPDWTVIRAPENKTIMGVWGDLDNTLLISTLSAIYRSTDRGANWQLVLKQSIGMFNVKAYRDTLFTLTSLVNGRYLTSADNYSIDDGKTWLPYRRYNPMFELTNVVDNSPAFLSINPVTTTSGETYRIRRQFFPDSTATLGSFRTPGVITTTNRRINLPVSHQLESLYIDGKNRLYITGSDNVCEEQPTFRFCNGGRGVVYISKKPIP